MTQRAAALAMVLSVAVAACGDQVDRANAGGTDSSHRAVQRFRGRLPQGRFELPTPNSGAPHLFITLPAGYSVRPTGAEGFDQFFIVESTDPSIRDSTATTPGFLQVYVGVKPRSSLHTERPRRAVVIGGRPATWHEWTDHLADRRPFYARELLSRDFFRPMAATLGMQDLYLHLYVAGADLVKVEGLVRAAESLGMTP